MLEMKQNYYAANDGEAVLQVISNLGENRMRISVGNSRN
jgi:hypothetical protein